MNMVGATYDGDSALTADSKVAAFAWQAGGGAMYALNDRVHFDLGYRFYNVTDGSVPVTAYVTCLPPLDGNMTTSFTASELLFSIRIYGPFSGLRSG